VSQDAADRLRQPLPLLRLAVELASSERRQPVELRALAEIGMPPVGGNPVAMLEAVEGGVERALVDLEDVARDLLDAPEIAQPWSGPVCSVRRIRRSSVPWRRSSAG